MYFKRNSFTQQIFTESTLNVKPYSGRWRHSDAEEKTACSQESSGRKQTFNSHAATAAPGPRASVTRRSADHTNALDRQRASTAGTGCEWPGRGSPEPAGGGTTHGGGGGVTAFQAGPRENFQNIPERWEEKENRSPSHREGCILMAGCARLVLMVRTEEWTERRRGGGLQSDPSKAAEVTPRIMNSGPPDALPGCGN